VTPVLVINPRSDTAFLGRVREALNGLDQPEELAQRLRARYPDVVVRPRQLSGERMAVWYVYRDGRWTPDATRSDEGQMNERDDAIRATADDLIADADELKAIEDQKAAMGAGDPRADALAGEAQELLEEMTTKATAQREIVAER
jgi:hypothetical protein